jgi:hypothetical protein
LIELTDTHTYTQLTDRGLCADPLLRMKKNPKKENLVRFYDFVLLIGNCNDLKKHFDYNISIVLTINILNDCNTTVAITFNVLELHWEYTVITTIATNSFSIVDL